MDAERFANLNMALTDSVVKYGDTPGVIPVEGVALITSSLIEAIATRGESQSDENIKEWANAIYWSRSGGRYNVKTKRFDPVAPCEIDMGMRLLRTRHYETVPG